jgi:hypothetical protein
LGHLKPVIAAAGSGSLEADYGAKAPKGSTDHEPRAGRHDDEVPEEQGLITRRTSEPRRSMRRDGADRARRPADPATKPGMPTAVV